MIFLIANPPRVFTFTRYQVQPLAFSVIPGEEMCGGKAVVDADRVHACQFSPGDNSEIPARNQTSLLEAREAEAGHQGDTRVCIAGEGHHRQRDGQGEALRIHALQK